MKFYLTTIATLAWFFFLFAMFIVSFAIAAQQMRIAYIEKRPFRFVFAPAIAVLFNFPLWMTILVVYGISQGD